MIFREKVLMEPLVIMYIKKKKNLSRIINTFDLSRDTKLDFKNPDQKEVCTKETHILKFKKKSCFVFTFCLCVFTDFCFG